MKIHLSFISLLFLVVSLKGQTTNSTQQNSFGGTESYKTKHVNIYPNPSAEVIVIKVAEPKTGMEFLLYDAFGKEVDRISIVEKETQYLRRNLAKGIYTFRVLYNKENIESGKIAFE